MRRLNGSAASGQLVQSANAIIAALTARVSELSTGEDRTKRFARLKGFSDVGSLVSEVAQVPRPDAGQARDPWPSGVRRRRWVRDASHVG